MAVTIGDNRMAFQLPA